ncbi:MAG: hypothetical protein ACYDHZ_00890 [Dehalococcoidia bacterium]
MDITKAIEVLQKRVESPFVRSNQDTQDAIKIGIEALKRIQDCRRSIFTNVTSLLPGETVK